MSLRMTFLRATALAGFATVALVLPLRKAGAVTPVSGYTADSQTLSVSLTIEPSCTAVSASTPLTFGTLTSAQVASSSTTQATSGGGAAGVITMTCTVGTPFYVALGASSNDTSGALRYMEDASNDKVAYTLNLASTASSPAQPTAAGSTWGYTHGTDDVSFTSTGAAQTLSVGATLLGSGSNLNPIVGNYTDSVPIEINY